jgi:two-component system sensor histidine kinase YesM
MYWGAWNYSFMKSNEKDNRKISKDLECTILEYMKKAEELSKLDNILVSNDNVNARVKIFEGMYEISNRLDRKAFLYVYDVNLNPVISSKTSMPYYLDGKHYSNWGIFRLMSKQPNQTVLKIVNDETKDTKVLLIGKAIIKEHDILGFVVFTLDSKEFQVNIASMDSQTIITDEYGWIYTTNNYSFLDTLSRFTLWNRDKSGYIENSNGKYYITSNAVLDNRIRVFTLSSLSTMLAVFQFVIVILVVVFAMMILAVFVSSKKMAIKKTKDIYVIIDAFEKVKNGNLNTYVHIKDNDEFKIIAESYNIMLDSLKDQITRNKEMARLVAISQGKQLESQFNPHFLYNTLENIRYMCILDPKSASNMMYNLSTLLRYSISNNREEVTVKEDILYTENYLSILKYRFNQRFTYKINITNEIEECIIPKLIIQPMIENSIKYGFEGKENLHVEIKGFINENNLILICKDNGAGMSCDVLEETRNILMQHRNKSNHSGLYNIHRRVVLKFGEEYGIQIESKLQGGTILRVILPINYEEGEGGASS